MIRDITCIACPVGCEMRVEDTENGYLITGYTCSRGKEYALQEITDPRRILTSTIAVEGGILPVLPVKTDKGIPKDMIFKCMEEINKIKVKAPISLGDILLKNIFNTGANVVATRNIPSRK
jgi:CxxC motif-containing protein